MCISCQVSVVSRIRIIYILKIISIFPFRKLQSFIPFHFVSFRFVSQITVNRKTLLILLLPLLLNSASQNVLYIRCGWRFLRWRRLAHSLLAQFLVSALSSIVGIAPLQENLIESLCKSGPVDFAWDTDFANFLCVVRNSSTYTKTTIRLIRSLYLLFQSTLENKVTHA